jgi:hypothetical protein
MDIMRKRIEQKEKRKNGWRISNRTNNRRNKKSST